MLGGYYLAQCERDALVYFHGHRMDFRKIGLTFALAVAGTFAFHLLDLPLPFLFGPMAACLLAAMLGARLQNFGQVTVAARTILGLAAGASITPALVLALPSMAVSICAVPVFIAAAGLIGVPYFRKVWGFDTTTAYYASMPGGLQDMVAFGIEAGGNPRSLSLVHATRVLIIVSLAPVLLVETFGSSLDSPIGAPAKDVPLVELALMALAALVGWKGAERLDLFGASILGPLAVAAALSLTDLIHTRPPREAILAAQFLVGAGIGVHFVGVTLREIRRVVLAGVVYVVILALLAAAFSFAIASLGVGKHVDIFLAFAPGGQGEITILAIVAGADLGFVVAHHILRIALVITCAPVVARLIRHSKPPG